MAGKLKGVVPSNQPGISTFIQKNSPTTSTERSLTSPKLNALPSKKINMTKSEAMSDRLPADLKLLFDSLSRKLDERIDPLETKVNLLFSEDSLLPRHVEDVARLKVEQELMEIRLSEVERENSELKTKLSDIEDLLLENSIVLSGIKEEKWEEPEPRWELVNKELSVLLKGDSEEIKLDKARELKIEKIERIGRFNPTKGRPIAIKFASKRDADRIIEAKKDLRKGIFVDRRYCDASEYERKRLRPILTAARRLEEYRGKCRMEGKELYIKGKYYSWKNLDELPQNISTHVASSRQDANYYGYFSELNPLSNFHPAPFEFEGVRYHTSEQFIQVQKAIYSGDYVKQKEIMGAKTAIKCKILGKEINNCDTTKWNSVAEEICYPGILCKFKQNQGLANFLKNTGDRTILECCYDNIWGNGIPLSDPNCINPSKYTNQGIMGSILERVRTDLRTRSDVEPNLNETTEATAMDPVSRP